MTTVSVVIPTFNRREYLREALESVFAQTIPVHEVIVVNDGSTDGTETLDEEFPAGGIRWIHQCNSGPAAARNAGVTESSGDFVGFLDSDDLWMQRKLETQIRAFASNPGVGIVLGRQQYLHHRGGGRRETGLVLPGQVASTALVRREVFDQTGLFDEQLRGGEFIDWMSRGRACGVRDMMSDEVLIRRRVHGANLVLSEEPGASSLAAIRKHLQRRRQRAS